MDKQAILNLYDQEMRINPPTQFGNLHRQPGLTYFDAPPTSHYAGWVVYTNLDETAVDAVIEEMIEHFRPSRRGFEWKVFDHDRPASLKERLAAHGFAGEEREALAVLDLHDLSPGLQAPTPPAVIRLDQAGQIEALMETEREIWNEDYHRLGQQLKDDLRQNPDTLSVYAAQLDDRLVSGAWIYYYPGKPFADLFGGATLPAYRGRGLYTALVAARAQEAVGRGVRYLTVDASPMSRPILEKLGFEVLLYSQPFVR